MRASPLLDGDGTGVPPLSVFALVNGFQDVFESKGMRRPNHCIEGEIKSDSLHPDYSGLCSRRDLIARGKGHGPMVLQIAEGGCSTRTASPFTLVSDMPLGEGCILTCHLSTVKVP